MPSFICCKKGDATKINQLYNINVENLSYYRIDKEGNVYRIRGERGRKLPSPKIMSQEMHKGYYMVRLTADNSKKRKWYSVHILLARTFIPNPYNFPCVNHKNTIRCDNRLENLEWCTIRYNNIHSTTIGDREKGTKCSLYLDNKYIESFLSISEAIAYASLNLSPTQLSALTLKHQCENVDGLLIKIVREGIDTLEFNKKRNKAYSDYKRKSSPKQKYALFKGLTLIKYFNTKEDAICYLRIFDRSVLLRKFRDTNKYNEYELKKL